MVGSKNFLESDTSILDNSLRFIKNEYDDDFNNMLKDENEESSKIIKPNPGICVKTFKLIDGDKVFINICQSKAIPAPKDITTEQLKEIIASPTPTYRVPMSLTAPRQTTDKGGRNAYVCDVAISSDFFIKVEKIELFRDFLIEIIIGGLGEKYNVQLRNTNWVVLLNRKVMGSLVTHRVRNRDLKSVKNKLIQELDSKVIEKDVTEQQTRPKYRLIVEPAEGEPIRIIAELYIPKVLTVDEICLSIGSDCISITSPKRGYALHEYVDYDINMEQTNAVFNGNLRILTITMPININ